MLKKFLFTLIFILFFILLFNIDVFGVEITFTDKNDNDIIVELPAELETRNNIVCQSGNTVVLLSTSVNNFQLYFSSSTWFNYQNSRCYARIFYYDYDTNSFIFQSTNYHISSNVLNSNGFKCLYCTPNFLVFCQHDDGGYFDDNELIGYNSDYTLSLEYEVIDSGYRIFTNWFALELGIQGYWNLYIWTLDDPYTPLEDCDPVRWFWLGVF